MSSCSFHSEHTYMQRDTISLQHLFADGSWWFFMVIAIDGKHKKLSPNKCVESSKKGDFFVVSIYLLIPQKKPFLAI